MSTGSAAVGAAKGEVVGGAWSEKVNQEGVSVADVGGPINVVAWASAKGDGVVVGSRAVVPVESDGVGAVRSGPEAKGGAGQVAVVVAWVVVGAASAIVSTTIVASASGVATSTSVGVDGDRS